MPRIGVAGGDFSGLLMERRGGELGSNAGSILLPNAFIF
jgi:hypothetical protein